MPSDPDVSNELLALQAKRNALLELRLSLMSRSPRPQDDIRWLADRIGDLDAQIESLKTQPTISPLDPQAAEELKGLLRKLHQQSQASAAVTELIGIAKEIIAAAS